MCLVGFVVVDRACNYRILTFLFLSGNALVYGNTLEAFSMVQTLLAVGVPGPRVVLVQPPVLVPTCFNNPFVEDAVTAALKECGKGFYILPLPCVL